MSAVVEVLLKIAFSIGAEPVSWLELIGFGSGAVCVWLTVRQHILNWPVGLVQVVAYIFVFLDAKLYADAGLQMVYVVLGIWGWVNWTRGYTNIPMKPRSSTNLELQMQLLFLGIITGLLWLWLSAKTDSNTPIPDAFTTALSLVATYGQARKLIESWYFWILADLIYVPLYLCKHLPLTAILYTGFLALCVMGLRAWVKDGTKFNTTYECEF